MFVALDKIGQFGRFALGLVELIEGGVETGEFGVVRIQIDYGCAVLHLLAGRFDLVMTQYYFDAVNADFRQFECLLINLCLVHVPF